MIKRMESENVRIGRIDEDTVILTIHGNDTQLTIDELHEVYRLSQHFWDANDLWQFTKSAKEERGRYPLENARSLN